MYDAFARVYDTFMEEVPYQQWCSYLTAYLHKAGIRDGIVLDLGCGTGSMTRLLSQAGYDMIGVDQSASMLQSAAEKTSGADILWLLQDMRSFELYGTVRAVVSVCDPLNYILEEEELLQVFRLVNNYLDPGGLFLFDMNTEHKYRDILGDATFAQTGEDCAYIWENSWFGEEKINQYDLTLFIRQEHADGREVYERYDELHVQRAWQAEEVRSLLEQAGMEFVQATQAYTDIAPDKDSERLLFIAREKGKNLRSI